jgi:hypothetical protein
MSAYHPDLLAHSAPERNYEPIILAVMIATAAIVFVAIGILLVTT